MQTKEPRLSQACHIPVQNKSHTRSASQTTQTQGFSRVKRRSNADGQGGQT